MEPNLKALSKKRSNIKSQLTRFSNYFSNVLNEVTESSIYQLTIRLEKDQSLLDAFNDIQLEIEIIDEISDHNAEREAFEKAYYDLISNVKSFIEQQSNLKVSGSKFLIDQAISPSFHDTNNVRLPKLNLPIFNGSYEKWSEFYDMFNSLIHRNDKISDIEKFYYLKGSLEREASAIIESIEVSAINYPIAYKLLVERYDNKRLIIHNHISAIFEITKLDRECHVNLRDLYDNTQKHLRALKALGEPTDQWDTLIIYIISNRLDPITAREWESFKINSALPTMGDMESFLKLRCELLEKLALNEASHSGLGHAVQANKSLVKVKPFKSHKADSNVFLASNLNCYFCKLDHPIHKCKDFLKLSVHDRIAEIKRLKSCLNCFRKHPPNFKCMYGSCHKCNRRHNTLLHIDFKDTPNSVTHVNFNNSSTNSQILLSTACIQVFDEYGNSHQCRALLDSGAQSSFITNELCEKLKLSKSKINMSVLGINRSVLNITHSTTLNIKSNVNTFSSKLCCLIIPKICGLMPSQGFNYNHFNFPNHIMLADPEFNLSKKIDMLIGANLFWNILSQGQHRLGTGLPMLQKTRFGWIVSGPIPSSYNNANSYCSLSIEARINKQLCKFWELEDTNSKERTLSNEEISCEAHFRDNTIQNADGRFQVSLPFKSDMQLSALGDSEKTAIKRFFSLERKLHADKSILEQYSQFMDEYILLGHMSPVPTNRDKENITYYLPHHWVLKEDSPTTKLRVVFDASAKSSTGYSLNDLQMIGPTIQDDLLSIIMRFRKHAYVFAADVAKMYRQIEINPSQTDLQRIVWRAKPSDTLIHYQLNTVTYGMAASSYLAIRSLHETAHKHADKHPAECEIILTDFYVDDLLSGGDTIEEANEYCQNIKNILSSGCFELRKWVTNHPNVIQGINEPFPNLNSAPLCLDKDINLNTQENEESVFEVGAGEGMKTLGLFWLSKDDKLQYVIKGNIHNNTVTKRSILSSVAQIFDPLGLLSPCIITSKIILQLLWQHKLSWDESVPLNIYTRWKTFQNELSLLNNIKIPRHTICINPVSIEIHGFSDASEEAYGACVYIRSTDSAANVSIHLLCAKTRVSPLKTISMPRLELCGALILAQLVDKVKHAMKLNFNNYTYWTDSNIVLAWINSESYKLKTFVANRITEIQNLSIIKNWRHVGTKHNPADMLSRGINPHEIINNTTWWHGPPWLSLHENDWPINPNSNAQSEISSNNLPETRSQFVSLACSVPSFDIIQRYSTFNKLKRVVSYCLRFSSNCSVDIKSRQYGALLTSELDKATSRLVKLAQTQSFSVEYRDLKANKAVSNKSKLLALHPFIDEDNIIRVGGRLQLASFSYDKTHPILLPNKHKLTALIIDQEHLNLMHAGSQAVLASLRERYWPINGRNQVKGALRKCIKCFRVNPKISTHIMGDLPAARISYNPPFQCCGIDYAGPFNIKDKKGRGSKTSKAYICIFICFAIKAVHLELVTDLTSEAFIATLRRFTSRRGKPLHIYSDNGTNFVGAHNELKRLGEFLSDKSNQIHLANQASTNGINWHFIPARSPHFGGLWEAGVKSMKSHLKRVMGNSTFTFIDLYTVVTQIEAILNSRPLTPLSNDATDFNPLTPSHFLIGRPLMSVSNPNVKDIPNNRLSSFQHIQQITQHFWARWSKEYVSELQVRTKWKRDCHNLLKLGAMVIIKEDNIPPLQWNLGRITKLHPGADSIIRVVTVKTMTQEFKRSISKICVLPLDGQETVNA